MHLYFYTNLLVALAWLVFRALPLKHFRFRARKLIAQFLLASALVTLPVLILMPDFSFPRLSEPIRVKTAREIDAGSASVKVVKRAIVKAAAVTEIAPQSAKCLSPLWAVAFFVGMCVMLSRMFWNWRCLSILIKKTIPLHKIGRVTVVVSDEVAVPFSVLHNWLAVVVLPSELIPFRHEFKIALRHEVEHHRRRDTMWVIVLEWLVCGFYLNPAIYLWRKSILQLQELACDEALISRMRISKHAYGSCLLRVAEMALDRRFMYAGTTCMIPTSESNSHSFLRRRITMFSQHERSVAKKAATLALGTFASFAVIGAAYMAQAAIRSDQSPNPGKAEYDSRIQPLAEEALRKGMALHKASAGFAIVADPVTGLVLAVANVNDGYDKNLTGDWALSYPIQPASTIKSVIVGSALEHQATKIDDIHDCEKGVYVLGKNVFHDHKPFDKLSTADTVVQSSNICMIKISQKLKAKGLENAFREFGLGENGSVKDFPGARVGHVPEAAKFPEDGYVGFLSFGVADRTNFYVTPLEMVQAYGALANGGRLMKPIAINGGRSPEMIRDVISSEVSAQMRQTLHRVIEEGTAQPIKGSKIPLAGKTSTMVVNGNQRMTGFIGFAPVDQPKVVVYVTLFDVKGEGKYGSTTAAPVFREIAEKVVPIFNPER